MDTTFCIMKRLVFSLMVLLLSGLCTAGDIVRVSAVYEYVSNNPNESPDQAERHAFEAAKIQALEDKFGLDVTKVTNTLIVNKNENQKLHSESNVFAMGETAVRGEWIETLNEEVLEKTFTDGFWVVKVKVEGRARSFTKEKADIQFTFVRDIRDTEAPVTFRDGSDIFLRFLSPVSGYLCVYLVDESKNAYCLLPYMNNTTGSQRVEANKEYLFFSSDFDVNAQEYTLNCEKSSESNMLFVIFSPQEFIKATDQQGGVNFRNEPLLRELTHEALMKWLARNQTKDPDMVVKNAIITIKK